MIVIALLLSSLRTFQALQIRRDLQTAWHDTLANDNTHCYTEIKPYRQENNVAQTHMLSCVASPLSLDMALVPFRVSGRAAGQDLQERLVQFGPHTISLQQVCLLP